MQEKKPEGNENKFLYFVLASTVSLVTAVVIIANGMVDARIRNIELYGSAPIRERLSKIETDYSYLKQEIESIKRKQDSMLELLQQISTDLKEHTVNTRGKKISLRKPILSDADRVVRIYSNYADDFPLAFENTLDSVIAEQDDRILGFGWLDLIVEANVVLDLQARPRDKFAALRAIIEHGNSVAKKNGFSQMHVFPKDPKFTDILKKHLNFNDITGDCLVQNLKG